MNEWTKATQELKQRAEALAPWRYSYQHQGVTINGHPEAAPILGDLGRGRDLFRHVVQTVIGERDPNTIRALDLGCLEGHYSDILCDLHLGEVVAVDLSQPHVRRAHFLLKEFKQHQNATVLQGDVEDPGFLPTLGVFDLVIFHGLLYHMKSPLLIFDLLENIRSRVGFTLFLSTQFKGSFMTLTSPEPLAELKVRNREASPDGTVFYSQEESVYARAALRLNPAGLNRVLRGYGYKQSVAYDSPLGSDYGYTLHLIALKEPRPDLARDLSLGHGLPKVRFYDWDGRQLDGYDPSRDFTLKIVLRLASLLRRLLQRLGKPAERQLRRRTIPLRRERK